MEINPDWALLRTPTVDLLPFTKKVSLPVNARIGTDFYNDNKRHFEIGIKNKYVMAGILIVSLATKTPPKLNVRRKEIGGLEFSIPVGSSGEDKRTAVNQSVEVDGSLHRQGSRLLLDIFQLNGVLRTKY